MDFCLDLDRKKELLVVYQVKIVHNLKLFDKFQPKLLIQLNSFEFFYAISIFLSWKKDQVSMSHP